MITIGLNMDLSGFVSGLGAAKAATQAFAAVTAGFAATTAGVLKSLNKGRELAEFSEQTGVGAGKISQLATAMDKAGMHGDDVGQVISKMQRAIVAGGNSGSAAAKSFESLGLSVQQLRAMSGDQQLVAIGRAIHGIHDPAQRTAASMEIFGRKGSEMVRVFNDKTLDGLSGKLSASGQIFEDNAGVFQAASVGIESAGKKFAGMYGLFTGIAESIAPELLPAIEALNSIDLTSVGKQIGAVVGILMEAFNEGTLGTLVLESLKYGFTEAINFFSQGISAAIAFSVSSMYERFKLVASLDFWGGMITGIVGAAQKFMELITNGIAYALSQMGDIPGVGKYATKAAATLYQTAEGYGQRGNENMKAAGDVLAPMLKDAAQNVVDSTKNAAAMAPQLENTSKAPELFKDLDAKMQSRLADAQKKHKLKQDRDPGDEPPPMPKEKGGPFDFVSSLTKIGGNMFGATAGGDAALDIARQQLEQQRTSNNKLDATVLALKNLATKTSSSGVVYG